MMYLRHKKQGQAILEIALFGSIILALLGVMLQYGLKFGFQQRAMQRGYRRSLAQTASYDRGNQGSYTYFEDRHVPDPSNPIGVGSVTPFVSQSSVVRNYMLINTPDRERDLPVTFIRVNNDNNTHQFKTANFRYEVITKSNYAKYKEIYGDLNIKDPNTNEDPFTDADPPDTTRRVRILDACEGNLINYEACKKQCKMMEDTGEGRQVCRKYCNRGKQPDDDKNCATICNNKHVEQPWYCSQLDTIFRFAIVGNKPKSMNIQPDFSRASTQSETLRKRESGGVITTTDTINWSETINRNMVYIDDAHVVHTNRITTNLNEAVTRTCVNGNCP